MRLTFSKIISPFFKVFRKTKTKYFYWKSLCGDLDDCSRKIWGDGVGGRNGTLKPKPPFNKTFRKTFLKIIKPIFEGLLKNEDEIFLRVISVWRFGSLLTGNLG